MPAGATGGGPSGFTFWDPGACNCPIASIEVESCGQPAGSGLTVSVYLSSGGPLVFSGTTDASSLVYPTGIAPGTYYITVTGQSTRLNSYGASATLINDGANVVTLTAAAGYECLGLPCPIPTTTTLQYSGPKGTEALDWISANQWASSDGVVQLNVGGAAAQTQLSYNGGASTTTCSSYTCPPSSTLDFFDGSTVTE